jgi:hypothetical protein
VATLAEQLKAVFDDIASKETRTLGINLHARISNRTPVDTGAAKGNWLVGFTTPPMHISENRGIQDVSAQLNTYQWPETIYIVNNLPYIQKLEDGHSRQAAPGTMVALSIAELTT